MPASTLTNVGLLAGWSDSEDGWGTGMNSNLRKIDALVQPIVLSIANTPPATANGNVYLVGTSPSGVFAGQANAIARYTTSPANAWEFFTPKVGWEVYNQGTNTKFRWSGTAWVDITPLSDSGIVKVRTDSTTTPAMALTDAGGVIRCTNAGAIGSTLPTNASVAYAVGVVVSFRQAAAGQITITPAGGVTLNIPAGYAAKTARQGSTITLHQVAANAWDLMGDLALA